MPRGRPSLQSAAATPAAGSSAASRADSVSGSGRITRSSSLRNLAASSANDAAIPQPQDTKAPSTGTLRGRSSRTSLLVDASGVSASLTGTAAASTGRPRGRPRNVVASSESVSSAPTPFGISSESEFSTPGTSKLPSPAVPDPFTSTSKNGMSLEVHIPARSRLQESCNDERALRSSIYSMNPISKHKRVTEIGDSEDDDDDDNLANTSRDAKVALRLQQEEYAQGSGSSTAPLPVLRGNNPSCTNPLSASTSIRVPDKRPGGRADWARAAKKRKTVPDSEEDLPDIGDAGIESEMEEVAALVSTLEDLYSDGLSFDSDDLSDSIDGELADSSDDDRAGGTRARNRPSFGARRRPSTQDRTFRTANLSQRSRQADLDVSEVDEAEMLRLMSTSRRGYRAPRSRRRDQRERDRLEKHHSELTTMWEDLEKMPILKAGMAAQPQSISRQLKPFQLEGLAWMKAMENTKWKGGLLGDEMGLGKTIQAVSLIMSDYPAKQPSLVLVPPVALMQWQSEIKAYTDGTLQTFVYHGTNQKAKSMTAKDLKKFDVIMMSYNSLESMYRKQEKGFNRKDGVHKEKSVIHSITFHRVILDEAHCIKTRTTMTAKACFALKTEFRWCLTGTPLQNRIGELFSLIRFLNIRPFASYLCKQCPCSTPEWSMDEHSRCSDCKHAGMQHVSVFNQELLNPIQKFGNLGPGREAFRKLRLMTDRIMLRRLKKDHTNSMELPVKEVYVDRQFFGEEENDFANSIMTNGQRKFDTYVAQGVLLNNYANIFGLIVQMRQVADHPDLILKKNADGGQNVLVCCICDESAEDTIRSRCKHDFCRACVTSYIKSTDNPDCPRCHIALSIDLEQPEIEQDEALVKKSSIINRIKMENWTSSSKIELLVHELHQLRSDNASHKSIIFSQFTTMLQLIEWRLRRAGITTVMLDGSMTPAQRQASIEHFMNNVDVECFLVSLKAGGVALNLTEASRVFIVDPWWNPAAEWQSADRCHRIGQTRPCTITRLCIEDSVESRMVLIQEKKTSMIQSTVNADDKAMDTLSPEDMQFLFRGS